MIIQTFHITEEKVNKDQTFVVVSQQTHEDSIFITQISKVLDTRLLSPAKFYADCAILEYAYIYELFYKPDDIEVQGLIRSCYLRAEDVKESYPWFIN